MAFAAAAAEPEEVRVVDIFLRTWALAARHFPTYGALTAMFGVMPFLLAAALLGLESQQVGAAAPGQRAFAMSIYFAGDVILWPALARMTLAAAAGEVVSLRRALAIPRQHWLPLLTLTALFDIPSLAINLASGMVSDDPNVGMMLYGARFLLSMGWLATFGCATAALTHEGGTAIGALKRSFALTRGSRLRIGLFFTVFFIFKVAGPFLLAFSLFEYLQSLATGAYAEPVRLGLGMASTVLWIVLCCALSISAALIYADLLRLREGRTLKVT